MPLPSAFETLAVVLFPPRCAGCDRRLAERPRHGLCRACFEVLEPNLGARCVRCDLPTQGPMCRSCATLTPAFDRTRAPYIYGGPLVELILGSKFRGREDLAAAQGRLIAIDPLAREAARGASALVPVPLGGKRRRERGYNQAAIMARVLGRAWCLPVGYSLKRVRNTAPQSDLPLALRRENVAHAFAPTGTVTGHVLLVDDVMTSAETARAAATALKNAGATEVTVLALARAALD
jgi:ComF family protein